MERKLSLNERLALRITRVTGTMWTAYAFAALSLVSLPAAIRSHDAFVIVSWISQSFLQLVLLPIILVGQQLMVRHHERAHRTREEHGKKLDAILEAVKGR